MTRKTADKTANTGPRKADPAAGGVSTAMARPSPLSGVSLPLGAHPGNTGGKAGRSGRPANEIRAMMRDALGERMPVYAAIIDGIPLQRTRVAIADVYKHVACSNCGALTLEPKDAEHALAEIEVEISASLRDKLAALDQLGRYGLGTLKEISLEVVRERMKETLQSIQRHTSVDQYEAIVSEIQPLWK